MRALKANSYFRFLVVFSLMLLAGCAENAVTVQKGMTDAVETATLREIRVSGEGQATRVDIAADRPLTYTSYSDKDPRRLVLDISNAEPGTVKAPELDASLLVKKIDVAKNELTAGSLVRIALESNEDVDYAVSSNPANMAMITVIASPKAKPAAQAPVQAAAVESAPAVKAEERPAAQAPVKVVEIPQAEPVNAEKPALTAKSVVSPANTLIGINAVSDGIEIRTTSPVHKYRQFTMSKPQRLVMDIYGFKSQLGKSVKVNAFGIDNARIGEYSDKTRIVFDASATAFPAYEIEKLDSGLKVKLQAVAAASPAAPAVPEKEAASGGPVVAVAPPNALPPSVEAIDFKVVEGVSRVEVTVARGCEMAEPVKTADGIMLTFKSCQLPKSLQRPYDTSAIDSVVKKMTPYQVRQKGRKDAKIFISLRESAPYNVKREDSKIILDINNPKSYASVLKKEPLKPVVDVAGHPEAAKAGEQAVVKGNGEFKQPGQRGSFDKNADKVYTGKRVTLEFADADIRKIFQLIAEVSSLNILVADDVTGNISIKLVNVPWDQALDVILDTKGLAMKRAGNIVVIRQSGDMINSSKAKADAQRAYENSLDLRMKIFEVNYAEAKDIAAQFEKCKSDRGMISIDTRTNTIIVNEVAPAIEKMMFLLKSLDTPEKQVLIEARIVEATSDLTQDIGIAWGSHYRNPTTATLDAGFGGTLTNAIGSTGLAVAPGAAMGLTLGKLARDFSLDMRLSAAITAGHGRIVSSPKVVTLNNKAAKIAQGFLQPYQTISSEGTKTEFVEATLKLEVTPHITSDGSVSMKIRAAKDSIGAAPTGVAPPINKKEAVTEMLVKNGETTVIGGIYQDDDSTTDEGVPYLKDIPVLGWLFKSNNIKKTKTELLIFITPKIIE